MENIRSLIRIQHPELDGINIISENIAEHDYIEFTFENGVEIRTSRLSLINDVIGLILRKESNMKQETLEEAAERLYPTTIDSYTDNGLDLSEGERFIFKAGAEWQAERMYTEEDMIEFSEWVNLNSPNQHNYVRAMQQRSQGRNVPEEKFRGYYSNKELFEQFKKEIV